MTSNDRAASALADCVAQLHEARRIVRALWYLRAIRYARLSVGRGREGALDPDYSRIIPGEGT